jgi:outer membrane biosynthesis protein TonB
LEAAAVNARALLTCALLLASSRAAADPGRGGDAGAALHDSRAAAAGAQAATARGEGAVAPSPAEASLVRSTEGERPPLDVTRMRFDAASVREVMRHRAPEIQKCYERVLAETGGRFQGRVVLQFVIDREGLVSRAKILRKKSTLREARVHDCVLAVRTWHFPKPADERDHPVEYPFDLKVVR